MPLLDDEHLDRLQPANQLQSSRSLPIDNVCGLLKHKKHWPVAKNAMMNRLLLPQSDVAQCENGLGSAKDNKLHPPKALADNLRAPQQRLYQSPGHGAALTDTPLSTAPNSPRM